MDGFGRVCCIGLGIFICPFLQFIQSRRPAADLAPNTREGTTSVQLSFTLEKEVNE